MLLECNLKVHFISSQGSRNEIALFKSWKLNGYNAY